MPSYLIIQSLVLFLALVITGSAWAQESSDDAAAHWGNFRGPNFNGLSSTAKPPTQWSAEKNVAWKVAVPGVGSSSPVVWDDKVFVTTAINKEPEKKPPGRPKRKEIYEKFDENKDGQLSSEERAKATDFFREKAQSGLAIHEFVVLCYDRTSGKKLWEEVVAKGKPSAGHHPHGNYSAASPVTDGKHVYVNFGSMGLFCVSFEGKSIWKQEDLGEMRTRGGFGEGSSIALTDELVILPWDHEGQSKIQAFNRTTGKEVWKTDRDEPSAWSTPVVVDVAGSPQIIHAGDNFSRGYELKSGEEIWRASGLSDRPVATPVAYKNLGIFSSSRNGSTLQAYFLDKTGDISSEPAWAIKKHSTDCASLLLSENRLFYVSGNKGIISCTNAQDGSEIFGAQRLKGIGEVYSSPVAADGKVFVTGRDGATVVIEDGEDYKTISQNDIGEPVDATIALAGDQLFIRGSKHLFCIQSTE